MTGDRGWLVTFHPQSENRKRVGGVLGSHSPLYPVHVTPAQRMMLLPCIMSLPSSTQSRNFLTDVPRGLSPSQFEILLHWPSILKKITHSRNVCVWCLCGRNRDVYKVLTLSLANYLPLSLFF